MPGQPIEIEGAIVTVCKGCVRLGRPLKLSTKPMLKPAGPATHRPKRQPTFKSQVTQLEEWDVKPDYAEIVKKARERLNLTQEELGQRIGERTSAISLIERRRLKPSIPIAKKLEHALRIELLIPVEEGIE